jgi:hypothetical protein
MFLGNYNISCALTVLKLFTIFTLKIPREMLFCVCLSLLSINGNDGKAARNRHKSLANQLESLNIQSSL